MNFIERGSERVLARSIEVSLPDDKDLPFLEVAVSGMADALVTGNIRHVRLPTGSDLAIEAPAGFVGRWKTSQNSD